MWFARALSALLLGLTAVLPPALSQAPPNATAHVSGDVFDRNGAVGGTDWWLFANSFGTRCE